MNSMTAHTTAELIAMRDRLRRLLAANDQRTQSACPGCGKGMVGWYDYPACLRCIEAEIEHRENADKGIA